MAATSSSPTRQTSSCNKLEMKTKSPKNQIIKSVELFPEKTVEKDYSRSSKSAPKIFGMSPQGKEDKKVIVLNKETSKLGNDQSKIGRLSSSSLSKSPITNHKEKLSMRFSANCNDNNNHQPSSSTQSSKTTPDEIDKKAEVNTVVGYQKDDVHSMTKGFPTSQTSELAQHTHRPLTGYSFLACAQLVSSQAKKTMESKTGKTSSPSKTTAIKAESSTASDSKVKSSTLSGGMGKRLLEENVNATTQSKQFSNKNSEDPSTKGKRKGDPLFILTDDHITVLQGDPAMYQCNVCMKKFKTKAHIKYHEFCQNGEKPFKCDQCGLSFIAKSHYEYHLRTHTGERPYPCLECGKGFRQKGKLTRHMWSHSEEKPLVCDECGKGFTNAQALRSHYLVHTGERPFACDYCNSRFIYKRNLKKHIITTHTPGEQPRPYICVLCSKSFGQKWSLDVHLRTHSNERPHACDQCSRTFSCRKDLNRHLVIHSGEKPYKCYICGNSFRRKDNLDRHINKTHRQPKEVSKTLTDEAAAEYLALSRSKQKQQQDQSNHKVIRKLPETVTNTTSTNSNVRQHLKLPIKSKSRKQKTRNETSEEDEEEEEDLIVGDPIPQLSIAAIETPDLYILPDNPIDIPKGRLYLEEYTIDNSCLEMNSLTELQSGAVAEYGNFELETPQLLEKTEAVSSEEEDTGLDCNYITISYEDHDIKTSIFPDSEESSIGEVRSVGCGNQQELVLDEKVFVLEENFDRSFKVEYDDSNCQDTMNFS